MNATRTPPDLSDVFMAIGELKAGVSGIISRQTEEIQNSAAHRQRIYGRLETIENTLAKNTGDLEEMTPVFKRAQEAEQARKVYKWQARAVLVMLGGALTAGFSWLLKQIG